MTDFYIHDLDPVAFFVFDFPVRWYSIAYLSGFIFAFVMIRYLARKGKADISKEEIDDMMTAIIVGVIAGGRLGYVFFYHPVYYAHYPWEIFALWKGGMSFHGGCLGVIFGLYLHALRRGKDVWSYLDVAAVVVPFGLMAGRLANFVNGELHGRVTDVWWAVVFPHVDELGRHPSQLYEAVLEGLIPLGIMMILAMRYDWLRRFRGAMSGLFLCLYAWGRAFCEFYREPDAHIGFVWYFFTMGQLLSLPMFLYGAWLLRRRLTHG